MASINELICEFPNPFDTESLTPGNFWQDRPNAAFTVNSIHQDAIERVKANLEEVSRTHSSKTVLLSGDSGSGKSYLLGRLKRELNKKAFFAYIDPWTDSDYIWRHILRYTVDSLVQKPEGQEESQLLLWLKGLSAFKADGFVKWILGEKGLFIKNFKNTYPTGIYQSKDFFGILYNLTNPDLYFLACDWLRGDSLSEEDLKLLGVSQSMDTEDAARNLLNNFGRISADTKPIVLCFDQLDSIPKLSTGLLDLKALFDVNTKIHNQHLKNFLIIISIIRNTWVEHEPRIPKADLAPGRLHERIQLQLITSKEIEALWIMRLHFLHSNAVPTPASPLYPLNQEQVKISFPIGKTLPRNAIVAGRKLFEVHRKGVCGSNPPPPDPLKSFKDHWEKEHEKVTKDITKTNLIAAPELIGMLQRVLIALQQKNVTLKLLEGKYSSYSLSYMQFSSRKVAVVWTEDASMMNFYHIMKACKKAVDKRYISSLYLLRNASVGDSKKAGYKIYKEIFSLSDCQHFKPNLSSIHCFATYTRLYRAAQANELIIQGKEISLRELENFARQSNIFENCQLLESLSLIKELKKEITPIKNSEAKDFILNFLETYQMTARTVLTQKILKKFPQIIQEDIETIIQELCQESKIQIVNSKEKIEAQVLCLIPTLKDKQ